MATRAGVSLGTAVGAGVTGAVVANNADSLAAGAAEAARWLLLGLARAGAAAPGSAAPADGGALGRQVEALAKQVERLAQQQQGGVTVVQGPAPAPKGAAVWWLAALCLAGASYSAAKGGSLWYVSRGAFRKAVGAMAEWVTGRECGLESLFPGAGPPWAPLQLLRDLQAAFPGHRYAAARCGVEMALLDAAARQWGAPLWHCFGGRGERAELVTDITVPICDGALAYQLTAQYLLDGGFDAIKVKVRGDLEPDLALCEAIAGALEEFATPATRGLLIDANCGYSARGAIEFVDRLRAATGYGVEVLEQPVPREDWEGLKAVTEAMAERGIIVIADESCRSVEDVERIAAGGLAHGVNVKLAKSGVVEAVEIWKAAHVHGLKLMIGGMVESRVAMGFSANLAVGLGGFEYVDLDTPILMASDPVFGGYEIQGQKLVVDAAAPGLGCTVPNVMTMVDTNCA